MWVVSIRVSSPKKSCAGAHRHHHLLERGVAGALAEAVDRALDLPRAADLHRGERVGHRHAEVVVAVHRPHRLVRVRNLLAQGANELAEQLRHRVADRVRDVDGGRALLDHRLQHAAEEVDLGATAVLRARTRRRGSALRAKRTASFACSSTCSGVMRSFFSMCSALVAMKVWMRQAFAPFSASMPRCDVAVVGAAQARHGRVLDRVGDRAHRLEVAVRRRRESRPRSRRPACAPAARAMRSFSSRGHGCARALLAVAHAWCRR